MTKTMRDAVAAVLVALLALFATAQADAASSVALKHVGVSVALEAAPKASATDWAAIHFDIAPGWHTYWRNPGESGYATSIHWTLPKGVSAGDIRWPAPSRFEEGGIVNYGYAGGTTLLVPLHFGADAKAGGAATAKVSWLLCQHM